VNGQRVALEEEDLRAVFAARFIDQVVESIRGYVEKAKAVTFGALPAVCW
jgi:hypothetical protein